MKIKVADSAASECTPMQTIDVAGWASYVSPHIAYTRVFVSFYRFPPGWKIASSAWMWMSKTKEKVQKYTRSYSLSHPFMWRMGHASAFHVINTIHIRTPTYDTGLAAFPSIWISRICSFSPFFLFSATHLHEERENWYNNNKAKLVDYSLLLRIIPMNTLSFRKQWKYVVLEEFK